MYYPCMINCIILPIFLLVVVYFVLLNILGAFRQLNVSKITDIVSLMINIFLYKTPNELLKHDLLSSSRLIYASLGSQCFLKIS